MKEYVAEISYTKTIPEATNMKWTDRLNCKREVTKHYKLQQK